MKVMQINTYQYASKYKTSEKQNNVQFMSKVYVTNSCSQGQKILAFTGNSNDGLSENEMESLKKAKGLFIKLNDVFCTDINSEKQGTHIERIPNCLMLEVQNNGDEALPIEWLKKTADCNFVHLTDRNNDDLADALWEELNKSQKIFKETKNRTLINVEGFDRLITPKQNSFENIDSLKEIMNRCAEDFGATIVFSTKDSSKLTSEAIQPHRVTKINVSCLKADMEKYNAFLESRGYFKDYNDRMSAVHAKTTQPTVAKPTSPLPPEIKVEPSPTPAEPKVKPKAQPTSTQPKPSEKVVVSKPSTPPSSKTSTSKPSEGSGNIASTSRVSGTKATDKPSATPSETVNNTIKESSKDSKALKVVAVLVAIGAAVAGIIYFMKNKNNKNENTINK